MAYELAKRCLPMVLWMGLIFAASSDLGSEPRTSAIIVPLLRWFAPDVSPETVRKVQFVTRKCAHFFVYSVLALLTWHAISPPRQAPKTASAQDVSRTFYAYGTPNGNLMVVEANAGFPSAAPRSPKPSAQRTTAWSWQRAGLTLLICLLYALSDEFHQSLVASRQGSPWDVLIDVSGALTALALAWTWCRWRGRSPRRPA